MIRYINDLNCGYQFTNCHDKWVLPAIGFADDILLLADNHHSMKRQVARLEEFCNTYRMQVNARKSAYTHNRFCDKKDIVIQNKIVTYLEPGESYKYLGLHI